MGVDVRRLPHGRARRSSWPKGNPQGVQTLDDLCGQVVAVQKDTEQDIRTVPDAVRRVPGGRARPEVNVVVLGSEAGVLEQLRAGRAVAVLVDAVVAGYSAKTVGWRYRVRRRSARPAGAGTYGIAVARRERGLRDALVRRARRVDGGRHLPQRCSRRGGSLRPRSRLPA